MGEDASVAFKRRTGTGYATDTLATTPPSPSRSKANKTKQNILLSVHVFQSFVPLDRVWTYLLTSDIHVSACESLTSCSSCHVRVQRHLCGRLVLSFWVGRGQEVPILDVNDHVTNFQWCGRVPDRTTLETWKIFFERLFEPLRSCRHSLDRRRVTRAGRPRLQALGQLTARDSSAPHHTSRCERHGGWVKTRLEGEVRAGRTFHRPTDSQHTLDGRHADRQKHMGGLPVPSI